MRIVATTLGLLAAALSALATYFLREAFSIDIQTGPADHPVANIALMHVQNIGLDMGLASAIGAVIMLAACALVIALAPRS
jgi:predicted amidohydrolase